MVDYALPAGMQTYDNLLFWANPILADIDARLGAGSGALAVEIAARIADVDAEEAARIAADNLRLLLTGGTLSGFLTLHAAPTADMHAATKKYVDDTVAASPAFAPLTTGAEPIEFISDGLGQCVMVPIS